MKEIYIVNYESDAAAYGIGTYLKQYCDCLKTIGHKVNRIEFVSGLEDFIISEEDGVRLFTIPFLDLGRAHNLDAYHKSACELLRLYIQDSQSLIFHFHYLYVSVLVDEFQIYFPSAKVIFTIHYLHWSAELNGDIHLFRNILSTKDKPHIKKKYARILKNQDAEKALFEKMDAVICLSDDTYSLMKTEYAICPEKLHLIPNGLEPILAKSKSNQKLKLRRKYGLLSHEKIILFVGRIDKIKGLYPLLSCFEKISKQYPECRLIVVGDGNISAFVKKCKAMCTKVSFTGKLNAEELTDWYRLADIGVFPSYYEECSYVGIEMMMHGLPIVASDGYSVRNMFRHEENAFVAAIGNPNRMGEFKNHLEELLAVLLSSADLRTAMGAQTQKIYHSYYTQDKMMKRYESFFQNL